MSSVRKFVPAPTVLRKFTRPFSADTSRLLPAAPALTSPWNSTSPNTLVTAASAPSTSIAVVTVTSPELANTVPLKSRSVVPVNVTEAPETKSFTSSVSAATSRTEPSWLETSASIVTLSPTAPRARSVMSPDPSATTAELTVSAPSVRSTSIEPPPALVTPIPPTPITKPFDSVTSTFPLSRFTALRLSTVVSTVMPVLLLSTAFSAVIKPPT